MLKFSVAIPTRNRSATLFHSVNSTLLQEGNYEVVVSDNNSDDGTAQILQELGRNKKLVWSTSEQTLSMRQNFQRTLDMCSGDIIIFIGDDDLLIPGAINLLDKLFEQTDAEIINWSEAVYMWPDATDDQIGDFRLRMSSTYGKLEKLDASERLDDFLSASVYSTRTLADAYHGAIRRDFFDKVAKATQKDYFSGFLHDLYTGLANLTFNPRLYFLNHPCSIFGGSRRSTGIALFGNDTAKAKELDRQIAKDELYDFEKSKISSMDLHKVETPSASILATILEIQDSNLLSPETLEFNNYISRIAAEIQRADVHRITAFEAWLEQRAIAFNPEYSYKVEKKRKRNAASRKINRFFSSYNFKNREALENSTSLSYFLSQILQPKSQKRILNISLRSGKWTFVSQFVVRIRAWLRLRFIIIRDDLSI